MNGINGLGAKRISGLATGMNTDEIIEGMMIRSKTKLNQKNQSRQILKWRQDAYRQIIRSTNAFTNKWLNKTDSKHNIGNDAFWKLNAANTDSKNFKVVAKNGAMNGNIKVDYVKQLATSETLSSKKFENTFIGTGNPHANATEDQKKKYMEAVKTELDRMEKAGIEPSVTVDVDGISRTIKFDFKAEDLASWDKYNEALKTQLKDGIQRNFGSKVQIIDKPNGDFGIASNNKITMKGTLLHDVGIASGVSNKPDIYSSIKNVRGQFGNIAGGEFSFKINGTEFHFSENDSINRIMNTVNSSNCGVKMSFSEYSNTFKITATQEGAVKGIDIEQSSGNLLTELFGVESGSSLSSKSILGPVKAENGFVLSELRNNIASPFTITMTDASGKKISKVIQIPTRDSRGNKLDYSEYKEDQIINLLDTEINKAFDSKKFDVTVKGGKLEINHRDGALLELSGYNGDNKMLNIMGFKDKATNAIDGTTKLSDLGFKKDDEITVDGNKITITDNMTINDLKTQSNNAITFENGRLKIKADSLTAKGGAADVFGLVKNIDGVGEYKATKAADVDFTEKLSTQFGVSGNATVEVGGVRVNIKSDMTVKEMVDTINAEYAKTNPGKKAINFDEYGNIKFNVVAKDVSGGFLNSIFKTGDIPANSVGVVNTRNAQGKDAIFSINGEEIIKSSNTIDYDGVEITFNNTFDKAETITVSSDVDEAVKQIKEFMEDYNKLIDEVKGKLIEKEKYKEFAPLTAEQKKEMSKDEIEKWEKEAQTGLLANDKELTKYLQELRSIMYEKAPNGLALYDLGITTGDWKDGGKLKFVDKINGKTGEEHLREMLTNNPDKVKNMFTDPDNGLAARLNKVNDAAMNTSSSKRGYLANIAGMEGTFSDSDNILSKKIKDLDEEIKKFEESMKREEERYWQQFTNLEKVISKLNAQSASLFDQMMG